MRRIILTVILILLIPIFLIINLNLHLLITLFLIILEIIILGTIYKIIKTSNKRGYITDHFKTKENISYIDILKNQLKNLNIETTITDNILIYKNIKIMYLDDKGVIKGNKEDKYLTLNNKEINNPFNKTDEAYIIKTQDIKLISNNIKLQEVSQLLFLIERKHYKINSKHNK